MGSNTSVTNRLLPAGCYRPRRQAQAGVTLVELLVAVAIASLLMSLLAQVLFYSGRSLASLSSFTDLDFASNHALVDLSRDVREARELVQSTEQMVLLKDGLGRQIQYYWDKEGEVVRRIMGEDNRIVLRRCKEFRLTTYQRNVEPGALEPLPVLVPGTAKVLQVEWVCRQGPPGAFWSTESTRSTRFTLRSF
jgi:prepilin-type N-terminal cleavage/methylation domain-containing protein